MSIGGQRRVALNRVLYALLASGLFLATWDRGNLYGATVSFGLAAIIANSALMTMATRTSSMFPSVASLSIKSGLVQALLGSIAIYWLPLSFTISVLTWVAAVAVFVGFANYNLQEIRLLAGIFVPGSRFRRERSGESTVQAEAAHQATANR